MNSRSVKHESRQDNSGRYLVQSNAADSSEFILQHTQKLTKTGNWNFDVRTEVTQWSDEMFNIHGVHREFNTSDYHAVLELYEESSRQIFLDAGKKLFEDKTPFDITARILTPLGHTKWVRVLGFPKIENGEVIGIAGITTDITAMRKSESLLKASEARFTRTFRASSDMMAVMREEDQIILDVNDRVTSMLGYSRDELIGRVSPGKRFYKDPSDREKFMASYFDKGSAEMECPWLKKTGETIPVLLKGSRIEINDQFYFLFAITDLSVSKMNQPDRSGSLPHHLGLNRLLKQLEISNDDPASKLALPTADGLIFIRPKEILFCEADSNYTRIHLINDRKYVISKTLKNIERLLPREIFFRIHNSHIINLSYVKKYNKGIGTVLMDNGSTLDVAKRKKDDFLSRLGIGKSSGQRAR